MDKKPIFILGCERSGSTWIYNILDSDPYSLCYMEPFADYASLFPEFPQRFSYIPVKSFKTVDWLRTKIFSLYSAKYPFFYQPGRHLVLKKMDAIYVTIWQNLARALGLGIPKKLENFNLLNLNGLSFKKVSPEDCQRMVIKDLRLNFKVALIHSCFPDARIVVAIRNPILQIHSIIQRFRKGNLKELSRSLFFFESLIAHNARFEKYFDLAQGFSKRDEIDQLTIYWLISYNTLIEDLDARGLDYYVASNDRLSLNALPEFEMLLDFLDIEMSSATRRYVQYSTTSNASTDDAITTNRDSGNYYRSLMQNIKPEFESRILGLINGRLNAKLVNSCFLGN